MNIYLDNIEADYPELYNAYGDLFDYFTSLKSLPSINGWGEKLRDIVIHLISVYLAEVEAIDYDVLLTKSQKILVNIGFATFDDEEYLSPFHPLNLAYYLNLVNHITNDSADSFKNLPSVTIDRLNAQGLLPFVYHPTHEFSYNQLERENCMWLKLVPQQETSYSYVRKLVKEKVTEFKDAFSALFTSGDKSTLIINSVNNQKNTELFLGLVDYVKRQKDKVCQIHVNLYDDELDYTEFDKFAETASYDEIKIQYELNKGSSREIADTIIDLLRTRLTYSKFQNSKVEKQTYAHLSFFRNNNKVEPVDVNVEEELSGIVCNGLFAGEAAATKEESYFTCFGLKNVDVDELPHLRIAKRLGGLIKPSRKSNEQYSRSKSLALAVSDNFKSLLERSYNSSTWTTIIDPKVTLDFFNNATDLVLIHYSDNYTNSVNYDAITVSKETSLYKKVLEQDEGGITEEFNAFNGEWLLKMITANNNDRKEKKGIIGAYKFVNCLLSQSDITWIPLSVAEMIRVAGNIGLKMTDSDFSRNVQGYKSGLISDDVLFVGFKNQQMYLLPLEVKTGVKQTHNKGVQQAKELKRYLTEDILGRQDFAGGLYRGLFIRQILMQVDKYKLYNLYKGDYFNEFINQREWWLQGDYCIAEVDNYPDGFLVSHVENDTFFEADFSEVENILKIQLPISYLRRLVSTPLQTLMHDVCPEKLCHVPEKYLLGVTTNRIQVLDNNSQKETENQEFINSDKKPETVDYDQGGSSFPQVAEGAIQQSTKTKPATDTLKVLLGHNVQNEQPILWEPTNTNLFLNAHMGIVGVSGTGKTQCTKSVITQLYQNQHNNVESKEIGILIFDYKQDYVDDEFLEITKSKKYDLHRLPYNPLSLYGDTAMLPVHTGRGFAETMGKAFGLGPKQQLKLRKLISEAYDLAGIKKGDPSTWHKPAPTIADVWALFEESEPTEDSLYAALESLYELEVFEPNVEKCQSLYNLVDGITVIELGQGYSDELKNLVVALTLDVFYAQMQKSGKPKVDGDFRQITKFVLVDEADNFMKQNFISLRKILNESREYGVGIILSTQEITHFKTSDNDYSSSIRSWVVHEVPNISNKDIKALFNKDDKAEQDQLMKVIRELKKHHSLFVIGGTSITKIKDKAFWELLKDD